MPRNSEKNALVREERRQQILKAALLVYIRRGYFGTDMEEVAREAQLAKGLVYYYYKTKRDLFQELFTWMFEKGTTISQDLIKNVEGLQAVDQLMRYSYGMFEANNENPGMIQFFIRAPFDAYAIFDPVSWQQGVLQSDMHHKTITKLIENGIQECVIPKVNAQNAANSYWSVFVANLYQYAKLIEGEEIKLENTAEIFKEVIRFCFQGLGINYENWNTCMENMLKEYEEKCGNENL